MLSTEWILYLITTLIDLFTALIILFSAFNKTIFRLPAQCKIGLCAIAFGFLAQSGLNLPYLIYRQGIVNQPLPLWMLQDFGTALITWCYFRGPSFTK